MDEGTREILMHWHEARVQNWDLKSIPGRRLPRRMPWWATPASADLITAPGGYAVRRQDRRWQVMHPDGRVLHTCGTMRAALSALHFHPDFLDRRAYHATLRRREQEHAAAG